MLYCWLWMPAPLSGGPLSRQSAPWGKGTYCTESCSSDNQEMDRVCWKRFSSTLSDPPKVVWTCVWIYGHGKWAAVRAMTVLVSVCLCEGVIQMAVRALEAIQVIEHWCAASRQSCLPAAPHSAHSPRPKTLLFSLWVSLCFDKTCCKKGIKSGNCSLFVINK